jgi:hypothetical protein
MKTKEQIMERIRECEFTIKVCRQLRNEVARQKEINAYIQMSELKWVLSDDTGK